MQDYSKNDPSGSSESKGESCCKIEAVLSVDERGQMVLPKEVRTRAGIQTGDKLALVSWDKDGEICCFALFKVNALSTLVNNILEPILNTGQTNKGDRKNG